MMDAERKKNWTVINMHKITVKVAKPYDVIVGDNLLKDCGKYITDIDKKVQKVLLVTETNVAPHYMDIAVSSLEAAGLEVVTFVFDAGEQSKNIETITKMLGLMAVNQFTRTDAVVALGGGVTTDMGGFAASIFLRGIKVYQMPTSLLAQVDASVGGKTGIDLKEGKNLVGAFHQPSLVLADTSLLKSLKPETFTEGMAEVIKMAFISDKKLYKTLKTKVTQGSANLEDIVARCVELKAYVVEQDEKDNGLRQTLNFGHTIGHVIERNSNFTLSHGFAVAKGMMRISAKSPILPELEEMLKLYEFPYVDETSADDIIEGIMNDKKKRGSKITAALVNEIGSCELKTMTVEEFRDLL